MTVSELLAMLHDLPVEALEKSIYIADSDDGQFQVEPVTESCDNPTVIGYVIVEVAHVDPRQMKFEFN